MTERGGPFEKGGGGALILRGRGARGKELGCLKLTIQNEEPYVKGGRLEFHAGKKKNACLGENRHGGGKGSLQRWSHPNDVKEREELEGVGKRLSVGGLGEGDRKN